MPAPTPETIRTLTETLSDLTDYLRENPDPAQALALVEPLVHDYAGAPVQIADILRALVRALQDHPEAPHIRHTDSLFQELLGAASELEDQHTLHYALEDIRALYPRSCTGEPGCARCR
ncbi:hypothetical protein AB0L83_05610 [Streptomyces sp. NPDC052071]|uniref:hypothetical protein n=1 Tax=Streptomyces TaxID=1883 RepID=UPI00340E320D